MFTVRKAGFARTAGLATAALSIAALLAGCSATATPPAASSSSGMTTMKGTYSATELSFAQMMIPHHKQAVEMADLALTKTQNAEIRALATGIKAAQEPEIVQMTSWLAAGASATMSGMDMGTSPSMGGMDMGMVGAMSSSQMTTLSAATGREFDRLFLEGMIAHHQGAIQMAGLILGSTNPEVKKLGDDVVRTQTAEIDRMKKLLASI